MDNPSFVLRAVDDVAYEQRPIPQSAENCQAITDNLLKPAYSFC